jgi:hypothetical protein
MQARSIAPELDRPRREIDVDIELAQRGHDLGIAVVHAGDHHTSGAPE